MFINLKKRSKAGVMLYALLMVAVFSLLLQFYLHCQLAESRIVLANREGTEAYLMAELTKDTVRKEIEDASKFSDSHVEVKQTEKEEKKEEVTETKQGTEEVASPSKTDSREKLEETKEEETPKTTNAQGNLQFSKGSSHYHSEKGWLLVTVTTTAGHDFSYSFPLPSEK
ncbi:competence type IV pilus minor pilin ComGG [Streptococcus marmotae]|uniref:competence type IV pilus minor pilin ComGG n=1 Tax=Streptococcus marmotae TaxID=1825069 RepID=UPI00083745C4|nr:competence type IV pilus minor pilin ComGG [Streptococcus marmotae]